MATAPMTVRTGNAGPDAAVNAVAITRLQQRANDGLKFSTSS